MQPFSVTSASWLALAFTIVLAHSVNAKCYYYKFDENHHHAYSVKTSICFAPQQDGSGCVNTMGHYDYYHHKHEEQVTQRFASVQMEARFGCLEKNDQNHTDTCAISVDGRPRQECFYDSEDSSIHLLVNENDDSRAGAHDYFATVGGTKTFRLLQAAMAKGRAEWHDYLKHAAATTSAGRLYRSLEHICFDNDGGDKRNFFWKTYYDSILKPIF